ncbi:MAG: EAL domain-containing protein [Gemmatimonadaceae bacterium]|nr:EAL domain-containing protein [Gemmatimonadaceae bacterium]
MIPREAKRDGARALPTIDETPAWALASSVASDGLWYIDVARSQVRLSPRALEMLGYRANDPEPSVDQLSMHVDAAHLGALRESLEAIRRGDSTRLDTELQVLTKGGERRWMQVRARSRRGADGELALLAGSLCDIDRRKRAELTLRDEARRDPLTALPNRIAVGEWLMARIARAATMPEPRFAVLYIDLDRFKLVNDSLGHAAGDALLLEAAARLGADLGTNDLLARVGGDEFVVLLNAVEGGEQARRYATVLVERMRAMLVAERREIYTTISVGVRTSGEWSMKPTELVRDADVAMYESKRLGGGRVTVFDRTMFERLAAAFQVQSELHRALRKGEFRLAYQPIFDGADGRLCGFEALVRWEHPVRGCLNAKEFVTEANDTGLIVEIGQWVIGEVCRQLAEWGREYPNAMSLSLAVNLCDRELIDPEFASSVAATLAQHDVDPSRLVLEMSEGVITSHKELAVPALRRLRDLGVQVQMDGFGSGSSSLSALRRLPISAIKIDRALIARVVEDEESRALVGTIAALAGALKLDVVAEGVETGAQAAVLARMGGFRYVQGHYFSRPVDTDVAEEMLE